MSEPNQSLEEIFKTLSPSAQNFLISMANPEERVGVPRDLALIMSDLNESELDTAIEELSAKKLLEKGTTKGEGFVVGEGNHYRLRAGTKDKIFKEILHSDFETLIRQHANFEKK